MATLVCPFALSLLSPSWGGEKERVGGLDDNFPLHDKDSFPPLHSLCKVKQFYCNRGAAAESLGVHSLFSPLLCPLDVNTTDCGTKFDLRSMWVLLNPRNRLRFSQHECAPSRRRLPPFFPQKKEGGGTVREMHVCAMGWARSISMKSGAGGKSLCWDCYASVFLWHSPSPLPLKRGGCVACAVTKEYRTYIRIRNPRRAISCL